jgi:peptidyl-prolyl cis-trans isomerase D
MPNHFWSNAKLLESIFSPDALEKNTIHRQWRLRLNQLVSARVIAHKPAVNLQLEDVKPMLVQAVLSQKSLEIAKKQGLENLDLWKKDISAAKLQAPVVISREQNQKLPTSLIESAMRADASKLPVIVGVDLGSKGYGVVKINRVVGSLPIADRKDSVTYSMQKHGHLLKT